MKVLHVIARMNVGGTATYLCNLLEGLEAKGVETLLAVGMVPSNEREDSRINGLRHCRINRLSRAISIFDDFSAYKELNKVVREFEPDIIHTHTFKAGFLIRLKKRSVPVVHTFHGHHLYDPEFGLIKRSVLNLIERSTAKRAEKILTIGVRVGEELQKYGIGEIGQYESIPPGIKSLRVVDRNSVRKRLAIEKSDFVIMWLSRFTQVKRPDLVLELARNLPNLIFVMAGDGEQREKIELAAPKNLRIVGFQDAADMWGIADIGLLTSDSEGMPLSVIEAQMSGVPVVATNVGSVSEVIENGSTGILTSVDPEALHGAIVKLVGDAELREKMGKFAATRAQKSFSQEVMVDTHIQVYREVLDKVAK
jgi:glycosyltransferase involved in cell wall biosynthesis